MSILTRESGGAANIGPRGEERRRRLGVAALVAGAIATLVLTVTDIPWTALATFPFFWAGGQGLLQAREKT